MFFRQQSPYLPWLHWLTRLTHRPPQPDMGQVLDTVQQELQPLFHQRQVTISPPHHWLSVKAPAVSLVEIWSHCFYLTLKFGRPPFNLHLGCDSPVPGTARFWLEHQQPHLPVSAQVRLFNALIKFSPAQQPAIHQVMRRLGGQIGFNCHRLDRGHICFTLPIRRRDA